MTTVQNWPKRPAYTGYGPGGLIFIDPDSLLARTATEALSGHRSVRLPDGEAICRLCGDPGPCPTARNAIEVCRAAGTTAQEIRRIGAAEIIPVARPRPVPGWDELRATVTVMRGRTIGRVDMTGSPGRATARVAEEIPAPRIEPALIEPTAAYPTIQPLELPAARRELPAAPEPSEVELRATVVEGEIMSESPAETPAEPPAEPPAEAPTEPPAPAQSPAQPQAEVPAKAASTRPATKARKATGRRRAARQPAAEPKPALAAAEAKAAVPAGEPAATVPAEPAGPIEPIEPTVPIDTGEPGDAVEPDVLGDPPVAPDEAGADQARAAA